MYVMRVILCLFSALIRRVGALQISIVTTSSSNSSSSSSSSSISINRVHLCFKKSFLKEILYIYIKIFRIVACILGQYVIYIRKYLLVYHSNNTLSRWESK